MIKNLVADFSCHQLTLFSGLARELNEVTYKRVLYTDLQLQLLIVELISSIKLNIENFNNKSQKKGIY